MATMNVSLPDEMAKLVEDCVSRGKYASSSEVVRAGLRLLLEREAKREWLVRELQVGLDAADRGETGPLDFESLIAQGEERIARENEESA